MQPLEIEVKFPVVDAASMRKRIVDIGAASAGRHFEVNVRFDDAAGRLRREDCLLRLRQDTRTTLTFKSKPAGTDLQFKIHRELQVQVSDFEVMQQILTSLGFQRRQVYEKWRETFHFDNTELCLDQMPFGDYLEIEGPKSAIRRTASKLGLNWNRRILKNYLEMFSIIRTQLQLPFSDITFQNFESVNLRIDNEKLFK